MTAALNLMVSVLIALAIPVAAQAAAPAGDAERGRAAMARYGCTACHRIPGVAGPEVSVGPSLARMGKRVYIAGVLPNQEAAMRRWLRNPPAVNPRTAMPALGVTERDAADMAAYLGTLN